MTPHPRQTSPHNFTPPPPPPSPPHLNNYTSEWRLQCPPKKTGSPASKRWQPHFTQPASRYLSKCTKSESLKYPDQLQGKRLTPSSQLLLARRPKPWLEAPVESRVLESYGWDCTGVHFRTKKDGVKQRSSMSGLKVQVEVT